MYVNVVEAFIHVADNYAVTPVVVGSPLPVDLARDVIAVSRLVAYVGYDS